MGGGELSSGNLTNRDQCKSSEEVSRLKEVYAGQGARLEAPLGDYRIDVVCDGELIEIQHGSLGAIRL